MWYIHKVNKRSQPPRWQGTGPCQPGVCIPCHVLDCSHALPFSELWGQRGFIPLPKYRDRASNSWCSKGMSKTSSSALPCHAKMTSRITNSIHCCVSRVNRKKGKGRARFMAYFSSIVETSCSREFPKISCPHLPPDPVSEHYSFLFSQELLLPVELICWTLILQQWKIG